MTGASPPVRGSALTVPGYAPHVTCFRTRTAKGREKRKTAEGDVPLRRILFSYFSSGPRAGRSVGKGRERGPYGST